MALKALTNPLIPTSSLSHSRKHDLGSKFAPIWKTQRCNFAIRCQENEKGDDELHQLVRHSGSSLPKPLTESSASPKSGAKVRIAFKGLPGAYSEDAALSVYPQCETIPCEEFEDVLKDKLSTKDRLVRRGQLRSEENQCTFCKNEIETVDHILLHCKVSKKIWMKYGKHLGNTLVVAGSLRLHFDWWMNQVFSNKTFSKFWKVSFFTIIWTLWMERNNMIFENKDLQEMELEQTINWRIVYWSKAWNKEDAAQEKNLAGNIHLLPILYP